MCLLQAGCVPVLFHRASAYDEYTSFLPRDEGSYSVFIPDSDVMSGGTDVIERLQAIPEAELERKREVIASLLPSISYEDHMRAKWVPGGRDWRPVINPLGERARMKLRWSRRSAESRRRQKT